MSLVGPRGFGKDPRSKGVKVRRCGSAWRYCDGVCSGCAFVKLRLLSNTTTTTIKPSTTDRSNEK